MELGRDDDARFEVVEVLMLNPPFGVAVVFQTNGAKDKALAQQALADVHSREAGPK
jgi:hypothetical protein